MSEKKFDNMGYMMKNKKTQEKQPDFKGKLNWNGKEMMFAAWVDKNDPDKFSIRLTDPDTLQKRDIPMRRAPDAGATSAPAGSSGSEGFGGMGNIFDDLPG